MTVFISYNRRDAAHAQAINTWLNAQDAPTFFDQRDLGGGQLWVQDLQAAIDGASAVAVLVGPSRLGNTQVYEFDYAMIRRSREAGFPVIPVILPGAQDWQLTGFLELLTWIDTRGGDSPLAAPDALQRLLAAIRRDPVDTIQDSICPYKGMTWFAEDDYRIFHGRDDEVTELHELLTVSPIAAVIGASGAGKSSLVQAGLLPRLRGLRQTRHDTIWDRILVRPGTDPLQGLALALTPPAPGLPRPTDTATLEDQAAALDCGGPDRLANHLRHRAAQSRLRSRVSANRMLILLDQAEELFVIPRHVSGETAIAAFRRKAERVMELLLTVAEQGEASLILTIRGDYYQNLISSPFGPHLRQSQFPLGRMQDLRPAIERPAELVRLTLAPRLADTIIDDVGTDETNLPLMQHALEETWKQPRTGRELTHQAYVAAGRVRDAIAQSADACYRGDLKSEVERDAARRLFLGLVRLDERGTILREQAPVPSDLTQKQVMEVFAGEKRRLLRMTKRGDAPVVELSHEALAQRWPRLREWAEAVADTLRLRDQVRHLMATDPARGGAVLLDSTLFAQAREWLAASGDVMPDTDTRHYIEAAVDLERQRVAEAQARADAERRALEERAAAAQARADAERRILEAERIASEVRAEAAEARADAERRALEERAEAAQARADAERHTLETERRAAEERARRERVWTKRLAAASVVLGLSLLGAGYFYLEAQGNATEATRQAEEAERQAENARTEKSNAEKSQKAAEEALAVAKQHAEEAENQRKIADEQREVATQQRDVANEQRAVATAERERAEREAARASAAAGAARDAASHLIFDIAENMAEQAGIPVETRSRILSEAMAVLEAMLRHQPDEPALLRLKGAASGAFSTAYGRLGDTGRQRAMAEQAVALFQRLTAMEPDNAVLQRDLSVAFTRIGKARLDQGKGDEALAAFREGLGIAERLARADPNNAEWQRDLSVSLNQIGFVLRQQGKGDEALAAFREGLAIRERLARADPNNAGWQRDLSVSFIWIGDLLRDQDEGDEALAAFRDGLGTLERLARSEPNNLGLQHDLSISFERIGDVLRDQGKGEEALAAFRDRLAIAERLARVDPNNALWQRDLSISFNKIGDVLRDQGKGEEALVVFRNGLAIAARLARAHPNNAEWQRDLSISFEKIGHVLRDQGKAEEAIAAFRDGLAIRERLARADPNNALWQRDVAGSRLNIGVIDRQRGALAAARREFTAARAIIADLIVRAPSLAVLRQDLRWLDDQLAGLPP